MIIKTLKAMDIKMIQSFNHVCSKCDYHVDLKQGRYYVDAKSIMGIFSLDMDNDIELVLDTEDADGAMRLFGAFIME